MFYHSVYLSLGSNLGHRLENLIRALMHLNSLNEVSECITSGIYATSPEGGALQQDFYNLAVKLSTTYSLRDLFEKIKEIEIQLGKHPKSKEAPRVIDIDLISFDELVYESNDLLLPHPSWDSRAFVICPLLELTDFLFKKDLKQLCLKMDPQQKISRLNYTLPLMRQRILE